ncbi:MAG TPA: class I SAM-dependent methyltransferase [Candidatus Angelobacter sp.]
MDWFEREDFWRDFYAYMFSPERFAAAKEEVSQIIALTRCSGGNLLDLCCGPGRHSVEFAQRGFRVTGVDRSGFLLDRAREHAAQTNLALEWVQADMRGFVRPEQFDLACNLFTSFGYFDTEQDDLQVLRNLHRSLKQGGALVIDIISKEKLARNWQNTMCSELADGSLLVQRPQLCDDWCRVRTEWILIKDGSTRNFSFEHNLYSGRELKDRLLSSGFEQVQLFGSFAGSPFDLNAPRLVAVARK